MHPFSKAVSALAALLLLLLTAQSSAEQGLQNCVSQFPGGTVETAPTVRSTGGPAQNTTHLCKRSGTNAFLAVEYDPGKLAALWVAYRIANTFGPEGCASMTRAQMGCYFRQKNIASCLKAKKNRDPFHMDTTLAELDIARLGTNAFSGTRHDRGHMAPNNTFSWHVCGAYKTFTMANMAAQWDTLNRQLWGSLEAQVLFWGVRDGPVFVVTGPIWTPFPSDRFQGIRDGRVSTKSFPKQGERLKKTTGKALAINVPRPTGFFKVVFRPTREGQPSRAIAFLAPHTKQTGLSFWEFVAPVSLIEEASGLRFGFAQEFKGAPDLAFWQAADRQVPANWDLRRGCDETVPAGWTPAQTVQERVAACTSSDP